MKPYEWNSELTPKEELDGAYFERNMLALYLAVYANKAYKTYREYLELRGSEVVGNHPSTPPCGWYYDTDNNWEGWKRVISLFDGRATFHIPDDFDTGKLPQIEPNWNGHSTVEKWTEIMRKCGCGIDD
ncbi:hypothetical protein D3C74_49990 [compost metagenome]